MEKLKMQTPDLASENFKKLATLFPCAVTEIKGKLAIDFDVLKQEISNEIIEDSSERYQFTWPDKKKSIILANQATNKTLRPNFKKSSGKNGAPGNFDSENIYIEGDNLDALKILRETYLVKVKMIYIDPPYNTGNDFVYDDDFSQDSDEYKNNSGQFDDEGGRLVQNLESNGRFHTDWLNMIYPRLRIARDFLSDDGVIFISIDDNEQANLKKICDEIFGEKNFVAQFIWQNKKGGGNDSIHIAIEHEYIIAYAQQKSALGELYENYTEDYLQRYKEEDDKSKFFWDTFKRKAGKQYYPITCPDGTVLQYDDDGNQISWLRSKSRFDDDVQKGDIRFLKVNGNWSVQFKQRIPQGKTPRSIIFEKGTTSTGAKDFYELFKKNIFSNPKPNELIKFLMEFSTAPNSIVMDFFSGSATTAHAVMKLNAEDGGKRKFILIQIPEETPEKSEARKAGYEGQIRKLI